MSARRSAARSVRSSRQPASSSSSGGSAKRSSANGRTCSSAALLTTCVRLSPKWSREYRCDAPSTRRRRRVDVVEAAAAFAAAVARAVVERALESARTSRARVRTPPPSSIALRTRAASFTLMTSLSTAAACELLRLPPPRSAASAASAALPPASAASAALVCSTRSAPCARSFPFENTWCIPVAAATALRALRISELLAFLVTEKRRAKRPGVANLVEGQRCAVRGLEVGEQKRPQLLARDRGLAQERARDPAVRDAREAGVARRARRSPKPALGLVHVV